MYLRPHQASVNHSLVVEFASIIATLNYSESSNQSQDDPIFAQFYFLDPAITANARCQRFQLMHLAFLNELAALLHEVHGQRWCRSKFITANVDAVWCRLQVAPGVGGQVEKRPTGVVQVEDWPTVEVKVKERPTVVMQVEERPTMVVQIKERPKLAKVEGRPTVVV